MILDLTGVYQDGSRLDAEVPHNARQALALIQGATVLLRLRVVTSAGAPVDLFAGGWSLVWSAKKVRNGCAFKRQGSLVVSEGPGRADFLLTATETAKLKTGKYAYDIFMLGPGGQQEPVVPYSELVVEPSKYLDVAGPITPSPGLPIVVPFATAVYLPGFDTSGIGAGRMVYASSAYVASYTDAADLPYAKSIGAYDGTPTKVLAFGITSTMQFSALSPTPVSSDTAFLARADDEPASGAAGKLTAAPPTQGFVAPAGLIVSVPADFSTTRQAEVFVQVLTAVKKAA